MRLERGLEPSLLVRAVESRPCGSFCSNGRAFADVFHSVTLALSDDDFGKLVGGKANAQRLFMSGKLKVKGDVMKVVQPRHYQDSHDLPHNRRLRRWNPYSRRRRVLRQSFRRLQVV